VMLVCCGVVVGYSAIASKRSVLRSTPAESVQARFCGGGYASSDSRGVQRRLEVEGRPRPVLVRLVFVEAAMSGLERKVCAVETGGLRRHPAITGEKARLAPQLLSV
jgi:hypothetical protein